MSEQSFCTAWLGGAKVVRTIFCCTTCLSDFSAPWLDMITYASHRDQPWSRMFQACYPSSVASPCIPSRATIRNGLAAAKELRWRGHCESVSLVLSKGIIHHIYISWNIISHKLNTYLLMTIKKKHIIYNIYIHIHSIYIYHQVTTRCSNMVEACKS